MIKMNDFNVPNDADDNDGCLQDESLSVEYCSEPSDRQDTSPPFSIRDRCWLCQCARKDEDSDSDDGITFTFIITYCADTLSVIS